MAVSEARSTFYCAAIPPQLNLSFFSMCTKLLLEVSTRQEKVAQLLVWPSTSLKIQRQKKLFSRVVHLFCQIEVFVALMSSTRWTTERETFCTKPWNNRLCQSRRLVLFVHLMLGQRFLQPQIQLNQSTIRSFPLYKISSSLQLFSRDLISSTWF